MYRRDQSFDERDTRIKSFEQHLVRKEAAWLNFQKMLDSQLRKTIQDCNTHRIGDMQSRGIDLAGSSHQHALLGHCNLQIDDGALMDTEMQEGRFSRRRTRIPRRRSKRIAASLLKQKRRRSDGNDSSVPEDESGGCTPRKVSRHGFVVFD